MKIVLAIVAMSVATLFTRAFPFILFSRREPPKWLIKGAKLIPGAVMITLVITSLPINITTTQDFLPWIAALFVIFLHLLFKHPLVSIFGGTAIYMVMLQLFTA
ncbi:MAG: hypothetical protein B6229_09515 [Spirochaetaceae bacterium 4572_7]|nr:MAG: hypothetical protein B6229_09515 [Spirochaetaceae bacterium 4572_7]